MNLTEAIQMATDLAARLETEARQAEGDALALLSAIRTSLDVRVLEEEGITAECMETFGYGKAFMYIVNRALDERPIARDTVEKKFGVALTEKVDGVEAYADSVRQAYYRRVGADVFRMYSERLTRGDDISDIIREALSRLNGVVGL